MDARIPGGGAHGATTITQNVIIVVGCSRQKASSRWVIHIALSSTALLPTFYVLLRISEVISLEFDVSLQFFAVSARSYT